MTQMAGQPQARLHRSRAVKIAAEWKFRYFSQAVEKTAAFSDAADADAKQICIKRPGECRELALAAARFEAVGHEEDAGQLRFDTFRRRIYVLAAHFARSSNRLPQRSFATRRLFRVSGRELVEKVSLPEFKHHQAPDHEVIIGMTAKKLI